MIFYEDNPELQTVWRLVNQTSTNIFLTGRAGTGKTTFLKKVKELSRKNIVVVAPTGVAAINANGTTIHSMFQLPFAPFLPGRDGLPHGAFRMSSRKRKLLRNIDLLVIDEISMVRADTLDLVDMILRFYRHSNLPFGGVQLLMIGDLHQLAPVVTAEEEEVLSQHYSSYFFFESEALKHSVFTTVILKKVYRQTDADFLQLLEGVRKCEISESQLHLLNQRYIPNYDIYQHSNYVRLMTHVNQALEINLHFLSLLETELHTFECKITGNFPESSYPNEKILELKEGARVMFVKNDDSREKCFYNGMLGTLEKIDLANDILWVRNDQKRLVEVKRATWDYATYAINPDTNEVFEKKEGSFEQFPVRLAWAITIHKSQGLTFDNVIINASKSFTHGQTYVALSRCRSLDGIILTRPILPHHLKKSEIVDNFETDSEQNRPTEQQIMQWESEFMFKTYDQLFNFEALEFCFRQLQERCCNTLFENETLGEPLRQLQSLFSNNPDGNSNSFHHATSSYLQYRNEVKEGKCTHSDEQLVQICRQTAKQCIAGLGKLMTFCHSADWNRQKYEYLAEMEQSAFDLMDDFENLVTEKYCPIQKIV